MSARDATKALREAYGDRSLRVCAIGVAGENGVRFAAVENDGRQAGRGGTGAVFGAKRLKAIALRGRGEVAIADTAATAALSATLRARALGPKTAKYRVLGTSAQPARAAADGAAADAQLHRRDVRGRGERHA